MSRVTPILLTLSLVLAVAGSVSAVDPLFAPAVNYEVGVHPRSVFSSDLDGDGDYDLAVANRYSDNVSILLNNGDGTFQAAVNYAVGDGPFSVFSADLDGDNDNDLAVANYESDDVSILLNNGDGTFATAVNYGAGVGPYSVFSADLDGDNKNDLVVANNGSDNVSILLNNGNGTFAEPVNYGTGTGPFSVFSADLDGDNDNDLAVANHNSANVSILLNNDDGTFATPVNYGVHYPVSIFSADLDGDTDNDLAVANYYSDNVSVLLNNGDGTFAAPVNYGAGDSPYSVFSADFDGDGDYDLAVANHYSDNVSILLNNGDGTFIAAVNYGAGDGPTSVFSADLDGDDDNDLAVTNLFSDNVSILINLSNVDLVAYWSFDDGTAEDQSGFGNHGTIFGATPVVGVSGQALYFDGVDDFVEVPDADILDIDGNITLSAWAYLESMPSYGVFVSKGDDQTNFAYLLGAGSGYDNGCVSFQVANSGDDRRDLRSTDPLNSYRWYHIVGVREGLTMTVYVDGVPAGTGDCFSDGLRANDLTLRIGWYRLDYTFFHGILDEVRIHNRALSETEVQALYEQDAPFCNDFTGLFCDDFEDGVITEWQVLSGSCTWTEATGTLSTSNTGSEQWCIQMVGDQSWDNYVLEAKVRGNSGVDKVLVFRVQDANNYYAVNLRSDYPSPGFDQLTFDKMVDGVYNADIVTADYPSANGVWYRLKVACADNSFKVYVDDALVLEYTDNDNPYYTGGIGLACWTGVYGECDISFDNVKVTDPFPKVEFLTYSGDQVGDEVRVTGRITDFAGNPYVPEWGSFVCDNPLKEMTEVINVEADGTFEHVASPLGGAVDPGSLLLTYGITTYDSPKSPASSLFHRYFFSTSLYDPGTAIRNIVPTGYKIMTGQLQSPIHSATQFIASKLVNLPPPPWDAIQAGKDMYRTGSSFVRGGWARTTESSDGKMLIGMFNNGHESCMADPSLGGCATAMGTSVLIGETIMMNSFKDAFHQLMDIASDPTDPILTPAEADKAHFLIDDFFLYLDVLQIYKKPKGWFNSIKYGIKIIKLPLKYMDFLEKYLPDLRDVNDPGYFSMIIEDSDGDIIVFGAHPKRERMCTIRAYSPVSIVASDPLGRVVSSDVNEIPHAVYWRLDADQDGDSITIVQFPMDTTGDVTVQIVPDPGADPLDSVSVIVDYSYYEEPIVIIDNVLVQSIPGTPYIVETFENLAPTSFELISPDEQVIAELSDPAFNWHATLDSNLEHTVYYDLLIASDSLFDDTIFVHDLTDTSFLFTDTLPTDSLDNRYFWKIRAHDLWGASTFSNQTYSFYVGFICGDIDGSGTLPIDIADLVYLVDFMFNSGPEPPIMDAADVDGSGVLPIDIADLVYLVDYMFNEGPEPTCP
ncbi:MAG: VCBS repeat-containing protein [Phycisphaerae bacterium]|nr:VCBS repeat-containing protein [Phycisphaerae bacterium]